MALFKADVAIVGGGIVGLSLALALHKFGINAVVIDKGEIASINESNICSDVFSSRVSAISQASQQFFKHLSVWDTILRKAPYQSMQVWEDQGFGCISFDAKQSAQSELGHIIENNLIVSALFEQAKACGIKVLSGHGISELAHNSITATDTPSMVKATPQSPSSFPESSNTKILDGNVVLTLDNKDLIECNLVVGADGGNSWVRKHSKFATTFWHYDHTAIVANVRTELPHNGIARQSFSPTGPLAFLPLADQHLCSIVWSQSTDTAKDLMANSEQIFSQRLQVAIDSQLGQVSLTSKRIGVPLTMQYARQWVDNGIALVGDAAHTIHPLAGQGVNLGLVDAAALADQLLTLKTKGKPLYLRKNLRPYERWRKTDALKVVATMEGFKQLFAGDNPLKKLIRNAGLKAADEVHPIKKFFIEQAIGGSGKQPSLMRWHAEKDK